MLSQIFAKSTIEISRSLSDMKFAILNDKYKYFTQDNEVAKQLYNGCYKAAMEIAGRHNKGTLPGEMAYKIMVFFGAGSIDETIAKFDQVAGENGNLLEFCKDIQLPICIDYGRTSFSLDAWKVALPEFGVDVLKYGNHLSRIEEIGGIPESKEGFQDVLPRALFKRYDENPELAKLEMVYEPREVFFNAALENMKRVKMSDIEEMPYIAEKVTLFEEEDDYFVKLPEADPRYHVFNLKQHSAFYDSPTKHGFYVLIAPSDVFDPEHIDWVNLEKQGNKILKVYGAFIGPEGDLRISEENSINWGYPGADEISAVDVFANVGSKLTELMPEIEVISDAYWYRSKENKFDFPHANYAGEKREYFSMHELYVSPELSELRSQIPYSLDLASDPVISVVQARKLLALGEEYLSGVRKNQSVPKEM